LKNGGRFSEGQVSGNRFGVPASFPEPPPALPAFPPKEAIRGFFESIAFRYDSINSLLSFRWDEAWRKKAARQILEGGGKRGAILDLGVGTGKFLERFLGEKSWERAVGVDFAREMLKRARARLGLRCQLIQADIHDLPFEAESFDLVISSFTLRSVKDLPHFFGEVRRVLTPGGKAAFLCLTRPSGLPRILYAPYLKCYLPLVGGMLSREPKAYRFLSESIQTFFSPPEIQRELESSGFKGVSIFPFSFGLATLILAEK